MKTSLLTGVALDYAALKAYGVIDADMRGTKNLKGNPHKRYCYMDKKGFRCSRKTAVAIFDFKYGKVAQPSSDWDYGMVILEEFNISLRAPVGAGIITKNKKGEPIWTAYSPDCMIDGMDKDPLVALMRCFVAMKLGDEVTLPEKL